MATTQEYLREISLHVAPEYAGALRDGADLIDRLLHAKAEDRKVDTEMTIETLTKALKQISDGHPYKAGKEARPLMSTEMARIADDALAKISAQITAAPPHTEEGENGKPRLRTS